MADTLDPIAPRLSEPPGQMPDDPGYWAGLESECDLVPDGDAIADLAVNNFYEMSDRVNDPSFLLQKKIEANFSSKYPEKWVPAYSLVTFSPHLRYSYALSQGKKQDELMREILQIPDIEHLWNTEMVEQKILSLLTQN